MIVIYNVGALLLKVEVGKYLDLDSPFCRQRSGNVVHMQCIDILMSYLIAVCDVTVKIMCISYVYHSDLH